MKTSRKILGGLAEAKVLARLVEMGHNIYLPFLDNGPVDMITMTKYKTLRVSIKGTTGLANKKSWRITLCTTSRRKDGCKVNFFDNTSCDVVAAYIQPLDKVIFIDATKIIAKREIALTEHEILRLYKFGE